MYRHLGWLGVLLALPLILGSKIGPPFDYAVKRGNFLLLGGERYAGKALQSEVILCEGTVPYYYRRTTVEQFAEMPGHKLVISKSIVAHRPTVINLTDLALDPQKKYFVVHRTMGFVSIPRDVTGVLFFDEDAGWVPWYLDTFVWLCSALAMLVVVIGLAWRFWRRRLIWYRMRHTLSKESS